MHIFEGIRVLEPGHGYFFVYTTSNHWYPEPFFSVWRIYGTRPKIHSVICFNQYYFALPSFPQQSTHSKRFGWSTCVLSRPKIYGRKESKTRFSIPWTGHTVKKLHAKWGQGINSPGYHIVANTRESRVPSYTYNSCESLIPRTFRPCLEDLRYETENT